jgi:SAM-dependent methyltransferase
VRLRVLRVRLKPLKRPRLDPLRGEGEIHSDYLVLEGRGVDPQVPVIYPYGMDQIRHSHRAVYEANSQRWDIERSRVLFERAWLDRFVAHLPRQACILDLGCGAGEPIARYLIDRGCSVTGIDFSESMLAIARSRFPHQRWLHGDMRHFDLGEKFDGIVAWDSFFHLAKDEQRQVIPRLSQHLVPGGALLVTVGPEEGETLGQVGNRAVYHASLSPAEYAQRLYEVGLDVEHFILQDPACDGHSVLLATARNTD